MLSSLRSKCQDQRALETTEARDSKPFNAEEDLSRVGSKITKAYPKTLTKIHPFLMPKGAWGTLGVGTHPNLLGHLVQLLLNIRGFLSIHDLVGERL